MNEGGNGGGLPQPTMEERLQQMEGQIMQMHAQNLQLEDELAGYKRKGKEPNQGRSSPPNS